MTILTLLQAYTSLYRDEAWRLILNHACRLIVLLLLTLPLASCQTASPSHAADVAALHEHLRRYDAAVNAGDIDALMALWADEAVMIPPEGETVEGKAACRANIGPMFEQYDVEVHSRINHVYVSGDLATVRLRYTGTSTPKSGEGDSSTIAGEGVYVYERKASPSEPALRGWRIVLEIWTVQPPPASD